MKKKTCDCKEPDADDKPKGGKGGGKLANLGDKKALPFGAKAKAKAKKAK